ncbi:uncharacterized protein [Diadema antillarum]|uniref:uncharacterized protein n=1 Tax=Diadema antillarum TaxID=105358 RepID=UPI003A8C2836
MFISSRFLRSMRWYHPSYAATTSRTSLARSVFPERFHFLTTPTHRSSLPTFLGIRLRLCHHGNSGDRKSSSGDSKRTRGAVQGGGKGVSHGKGSSDTARGGAVDRGNASGHSGGKKGNGDGEGYQTVNPTTIQVYADPTLSRTVRELSVILQRMRSHVKNLKEDVEDCTFEILRQSQSLRTLEKNVKETKTLSADATESLKMQRDDLRTLEKNLVFFSKMTANHDNQLRDSILRLNECDKRLLAAVAKLDYVGSSLERVKRLVDEEVRAELRELKLAMRMAKNDTRNIREVLIRAGIVVPDPSPPDESGPPKLE